MPWYIELTELDYLILCASVTLSLNTITFQNNKTDFSDILRMSRQ